MTKLTIATCAFTLALIGGCMTIEEDVASLQQANESRNALSLNALSVNALSLNALSLNALSLNALSLNSFELDIQASDGLETTEEGRHVLSYLTRCALAEGDELVVEVDGVRHVFAGLLGLARRWTRRSLSRRGAERVSGCLLAHANYFGVSVPISIRGRRLRASRGERRAYGLYEATFYGNLFASSVQMYACWGTDPEEAHARSSYRQWRICSDPQDGVETACSPGPDQPFVSTGYCADVCTRYHNVRGWSRCTSGQNAGRMYRQTTSVWLMNDLDR